MTLTVTTLHRTAVLVALALTPIASAAQEQAAPSTSTIARAMPSPALRTEAITPRAQAAIRSDYRLEPGDKLRIEVYKDAQLSQSVQVRPDGKITLPLVGDIEANGSTPIQLRDTVTAALKQYLNNPVVSVVVVEATQPTIYVVGEVNHPGPVSLRADMTVLQALAVAGGLKDYADTKNIRILRGSSSPITFNYKDATKGLGTAVYLQPGDTVVVPD